MKSKSISKRVVKKTATKIIVKSAFVRTNINIDKALHAKAKKIAFKEKISLNKFINNAVRAYVK